MKYLFILIFLFTNLLGHTQHDPSTTYLLNTKTIETISNVKKIEIIRLTKNPEKEIMDTIDIVVQHYSKKNNPKKKLLYRKPFKDVYKTVYFDTLGRIKKGTHKLRHGRYTDRFYYDKVNPKAYLINEYLNDSLLIGQYKNYFQNNKIIRQDYIRKDTLITFITLRYDSLNRLIRKIKHNTKYGTGVSFGSGFTKDGKVEKILDPNDTTLYKHKILKDTLITRIYKKRKLRTVEKKLSNKKSNIEITENHRFGYISERKIKHTWPDSSKYSNESFDKKGKLRSYTYTNINPKQITSRYYDKFYFSNKPEEKTILDINIEYDTKGNWIKKTYIRNNLLTRITMRKIEYFTD